MKRKKKIKKLKSKKKKKNLHQLKKGHKFFGLTQIITLIIIYLLHIYFEKVIIKSKNKISIIIPTYNRANLITRSINSVLNQTYNNIEVLVIDDGSTDNTKNEINKIKDSRIRYIKLRKRRRANFARNIGIKKSFGEYITFQDSDDIYHKDKLEKQLNNLIINKSDLDFCKILTHFYSGIKFTIPTKKQEKRILNNKIFNELSYGNFISTQSILVKKKYIQKYLFDTQLPRLQDYDLVLRMVPKIKVSYTQEILVDLYKQKDSISFSRNKIEKAKELLSKKTYDFDSEHQKIFINSLKHNIGRR